MAYLPSLPQVALCVPQVKGPLQVPHRVLTWSPQVQWQARIFNGSKIFQPSSIEESLRINREVKSHQVIAHLVYILCQAMRDLSEYSHPPRWILLQYEM